MRFHDFEAAWTVYLQMEALEWKHLPDAGGLLDQNDALMEDLTKIRAAVWRVRQQLKESGADAAGAEGGIVDQD